MRRSDDIRVNIEEKTKVMERIIESLRCIDTREIMLAQEEELTKRDGGLTKPKL
jgi:hypothetical protein